MLLLIRRFTGLTISVNRSLVSVAFLSLALLVGCGDGLSGSATGRNVSDMAAFQEGLSELAESLAQFNAYHSDFETMADQSLVLADDLLAQIDELIDTADPESPFTADELREVRDRITALNISDLHPRWSPDGRNIVFTSNVDGDYDLYSLNADGTDDRGPDARLEREDNIDGDLSPDWSGYPVLTTSPPSADTPIEPASSGGLIAFTSDRDGNDEIYVMNTDGTGQTRLTDNPGLDGQPSWSPDGTKVAFASERGEFSDIYVMNSDGSNQIRLTDPNWVQDQGHEGSYKPSWSPDGSTIAFSLGQGEGSRYQTIAMMTADGSNPTLLIDGGNWDWCNNRNCSSSGPFWAPDGTLVFYGTSREQPPCQLINCDDGFVDPGRAVYQVSGFDSVEEWSPSVWGDEIDSFEEPCVSLAYGIDVLNTCDWIGYWDEDDGAWPQIAWSPNGLLAYVDTTECTRWAVDNGNCRSNVQDSLLVVASSDYAGEWSPVALDSGDESPSFSPDGTQMVFVSNPDGNEEIYVWNADGSTSNRLTDNSFDDKDPSWGSTAAASPVELEFTLTAVAMPEDGGTVTSVTAVGATTFVGKWADEGRGDREFSPVGVGVAPDGSIYVADHSNDRIERFTPDGVFISGFGTRGSGGGEFRYPQDVAVASDGSVYVVDGNNDRIQKFDSDGVFVSQWGTEGSGDGQFEMPKSVAVSLDGSVYVADRDNNRIQQFTPDGVFVSKWGLYGTGDGEFQDPLAVAVAPDGSVYVADEYSHRIQRFTSGGMFISEWGTRGSGDGEFQFTRDIAVAPDGSVYVADMGNDRIQRFTSDGVFISRFGSRGSGDGEFRNPLDVAVASLGSVYVVDGNNNRIQKFSTSPRFADLTAIPNAGYTFTGWTGDCSGAGECTVTLDADRSVTANFDIEPSGGSIVFHSDRDGDYEIYAVNADGSGTAVPLTNNSAWDGDARRSPDGTKIVFTSNRHEGQSAGTDIYVMNSDGTGPERLTFTPNVRRSAHPSWSPDGQRIVFSSQLGGTDCNADEIYVMDADGSNLMALTDNEDDYECDNGLPDYWDRYPSWSPDGGQIIFASERSGDRGIYVMNSDGTGQTKLFSGDIYYVAPSWSPDGTQIAFAVTRHDSPDIYVMDSDGTEAFPITYDSGLKAAIQDLRIDRDAVMGEVLDVIKSDIEYLMTQSAEEPDLSLQLTTAARSRELVGLLDIQEIKLTRLYEELLGIMREYSLTAPSETLPTRDLSCSGKEIKFKIGNVWANETIVYEDGGADELNLTASTSSLPSNGAISWPISAPAQRVPPHVVVGSVNASDGTSISAWHGDRQLAYTSASGGSYSLIIEDGLCSIDTPNPVPVPTPSVSSPPVPSIQSRTINMGLKEMGRFDGHPFSTSSPRIQFVSSSVGEGLITTDPDLSANPMLAESWEVSDDFLEWTWHFREGVEFHKGYGEMTTQDVLYSYQQWHGGGKHSRSNMIGEYFSVEGPNLSEGAEVRIIDEHTLQVNTGIPWAQYDVFEFLKSGGGSSTWVVSKRQSEDLGIESASRDIAATGPWQIEDHDPGEYWKMSAVDGHWRQTPYFDELVYWSIPEESVRVAGFQTGHLDSFDMAIDSISSVEDVDGATIIGWANAGQAGLNFYGQTYGLDRDGNEYEFYNPDQPWVSSDMDTESQEWINAVNVRKAMNIAIDRQSIVDEILSGFGEVQFLRDWMGHEDRANPDWVYPYDPELARRMLADAGYPDGFNITLIPAIRGAPGEVEACEAVAYYWEVIGIDVRLEFVPYATIRPDLVSRRYQGVTCHTVGKRASPIVAGSNYLTNSTFSYGTHHPWLDEHIWDTKQQVEQSRIEAGELEIYNWIFDNAIMSSLYTHDAIWPIGPRLDPSWQPIDHSEIRIATAFEYARPR